MSVSCSEYNLNSRNQGRLHDISIDSVSGIQTFIDNANKSSNLTITTAKFDESNVDKPNFVVVETQPSVDVQSILSSEKQSKIPDNYINSILSDYVTLNRKQIRTIVFLFIFLVLIILFILIFK